MSKRSSSNKRNGNMNHELHVVTGRMASPGRSKHRDKLNKLTHKRIYSFNTLKLVDGHVIRTFDPFKDVSSAPGRL